MPKKTKYTTTREKIIAANQIYATYPLFNRVLEDIYECHLWKVVRRWQSFLYVTDGWVVYPVFINDCDHLVSKTYMTKVEGKNTRLRHYQARLKRKTLCYSKCDKMLRLSIKLLLHYLHYKTVPL